MNYYASLALIAVCVAPAIAAAEDQWSVENQTFTRSDSSGIRVTEPDGYQVAVTIDGKTATDTAPALFRAPAADGYYNVTFTAKNGAKWTKKIEVRKFQITDLRVKHVVADAPNPEKPKAPARTFIGSVYNKVATCGKKLAARVELIDAAGNLAAAIDIKSGSFEQARIPPGVYDFRAFVADGAQWTYQTTGRASVENDGWKATLMCGTGALEVRFGQ